MRAHAILLRACTCDVTSTCRNTSSNSLLGKASIPSYRKCSSTCLQMVTLMRTNIVKYPVILRGQSCPLKISKIYFTNNCTVDRDTCPLKISHCVGPEISPCLAADQSLILKIQTVISLQLCPVVAGTLDQ